LSAIVKVDTRHYRVIAQEHWGLTDEQMKGMHVHHRIHRSKGGSNDPSNLFVCSPWFHAHVWHEEMGGFIGIATAAGKKGGAAAAYSAKERFDRATAEGKGFGALSKEQRKANAKKAGHAGKGSSHATKGKKLPQMARTHKELTCPHCNKVGKGVLMYRWHFDNCKHRVH